MAKHDFLDLPGVHTDGKKVVTRNAQEVLLVSATYEYEPSEAGLQKHDCRTITLIDTPKDGRPCVIELKRWRYKTKGGRIKTPELPFVYSGTRMTDRLVAQIVCELSKPSESIASIARRMGCSEGRIYKAFHMWKTIVLSNRGTIGSVISIDGAHIGRRNNKQRYTVVTDNDSGSLFGFEKGYNKKVLKTVLRNISGINNVKIICIDLSSTNRSAVRELQEEGVIRDDVVMIADKRHVLNFALKVANDVLDELWRIKYIHKPCNKHTARILINKRRGDLSENEFSLLNELFDLFPKLADAYRFKELYYRIYKCSNRNEAEQAFKEWSKDVSQSRCSHEFGVVISTVRRWREEVFSFFTQTLSYTTAMAESMNNKLKMLYARSRGYRKRRGRVNENFHAMAMMELGINRHIQMSDALQAIS